MTQKNRSHGFYKLRYFEHAYSPLGVHFKRVRKRLIFKMVYFVVGAKGIFWVWYNGGAKGGEMRHKMKQKIRHKMRH